MGLPGTCRCIESATPHLPLVSGWVGGQLAIGNENGHRKEMIQDWNENSDFAYILGVDFANSYTQKLSTDSTIGKEEKYKKTQKRPKRIQNLKGNKYV